MESSGRRLSRARFTIRRMLGVISLLAVLLAVGRWGHHRYVSRGFTKTYYIGDLIGVRPRSGGLAFPANLNSKLAEQAGLLKFSITPDAWWFGTRSVKPFPPAASLTVLHTQEGHQQVATWLRQRRARFYATQGDREQEESASWVSPSLQPSQR